MNADRTIAMAQLGEQSLDCQASAATGLRAGRREQEIDRYETAAGRQSIFQQLASVDEGADYRTDVFGVHVGKTKSKG